jgi:hypothetical protein
VGAGCLDNKAENGCADGVGLALSAGVRLLPCSNGRGHDLGVPVAAIAEPQSVRWLGVGLREVPVDPGALPPELLADSAAWLPHADWLSNTELGFAGGFVDPLRVPAEPDDWAELEFEVPIPGSGFIESLARPGGNTTGFTNFESSMGSKWLELLKDVSPRTTRILVLLHPETAANMTFWRAAEVVAPSLGVEVKMAGVHDAAEIQHAVMTFSHQEDGGVIAMPHTVTVVNHQLIIDLAMRHRLPVIFAFRYSAISTRLTGSTNSCRGIGSGFERAPGRRPDATPD